MGKWLTPEEQMANLNNRARKLNSSANTKKGEKKEERKSFRELATDKKKSKKKKKNFNPFEGLIDEDEIPEEVELLPDDEEEVEDAETGIEYEEDVEDESPIGYLRRASLVPESPFPDLREVEVAIFLSMARAVIDDGIAPKSFYFSNDTISKPVIEESYDADTAGEILVMLQEYMITLCYPTAAFRRWELDSEKEFLKIGELYDHNKFRLYDFVDRDGEKVLLCYKINHQSLSELDQMITEVIESMGDVDPVLSRIMIYNAIIQGCGTFNNVFLCTDSDQLEDFYISEFNQQRMFIDCILNDDNTHQSDTMGIVADDLNALHVDAREYLTRVFDDNGLEFEYVEESVDDVEESTYDGEEVEDEEEVPAEPDTTVDDVQEDAKDDNINIIEGAEYITFDDEPDKSLGNTTDDDSSLIVDVIRKNN